MTPEQLAQLRKGQREAHMVTRTAYRRRELQVPDVQSTLLMGMTGAAYERRVDGSVHQVGVYTVGDDGKVQCHIVPARAKGKAARRAEKRQRRLARERRAAA